ncbi:MAG TPA: outer membrane beta-barrel protein, partial [Myxococcota bacterium]|nr:outer membrane beta-barrel protein [Myxococcota bacterium]
MKRISVWMASAAASLLAFPAVAGEDVESQLAEMKELVKGLQQKVDAQSEQLEQQGQQLKDAQRVVQADEQESKSALSSFIDSIDVTGAVIGSYNYNFNQPTNNNGFNGEGVADQNAGQSGGFMPYHRDANSFQVDQAWFGLGKPATEESRGGFQFDIFYGATASSFAGGISSDGNARSNGDSTSDYVVDQAYVEYLAPVANVNLRLGKFDTPLGAENNRQWENFNITHGIVDVFMQPVNHLGVIATVPIEGFGEFGAGLVNSGGSTISAPDDNQEKSYLATLKLGDNRANIRGTFVYGSEDTIEHSFSGSNLSTGDQLGLVDATAWFNPTDTVSLWANYDYLFAQGTGYYAHGIAVAGRVA